MSQGSPELGSSMAKVGNTLVNILATLEDGEPRSEVFFKIKSPDFRRYIERLGNKIDNMKDSMEFLADEVEQAFINHYLEDQGPSSDEGSLESWPELKEGRYKDWKEKHGHPDKLLNLTGDLERSLHKGGDGNIHNVTNKSLEIGTEIGYYIFAHTGFTDRTHTLDPQETKRTIIGLTDEEEDEIMDNFKEFFFDSLDE